MRICAADTTVLKNIQIIHGITQIYCTASTGWHKRGSRRMQFSRIDRQFRAGVITKRTIIEKPRPGQHSKQSAKHRDVLTMRASSLFEALRILTDKARQSISIVIRAPVRNSALQKVSIGGYAVQIVCSYTPQIKYYQAAATLQSWSD